jgi:hypothetical protein
MKKTPDPRVLPEGFLEKAMTDPDFRNPIDRIYDDKDTGNIVLYNEKNQPVEFIQIALITYKKKDYVILKPAVHWDGLEDEQALVFEIHKGQGKRSREDDELRIVSADEVIDGVFAIYNQLYDEETKKKP